MSDYYDTNQAARRRRDRIFGLSVRVLSLLPVLLMFLVILTLVNRSMGTVAISESEIAGHWNLLPSLFSPERIRAEAELLGPDTDLSFKSWLSFSFLSSLPSSRAVDSGLRAAIAGSFWIAGIGLMLSFPVALVTAMWASIIPHRSPQGRFLGMVLESYRRIPHVLYGICGLALFSTILRFIPGAAGLRSLGSAGLLMALILLPRLTVMMKDEMDGVSEETVLASYALGAGRQAVSFRQILPVSFQMIAAKTVGIVAGVLGLASPFIVLGAASFVTSAPAGIYDRFTTMSVQVFQWALRPEGVYRNLAAAAALYLLGMVLFLNLVSHIWRQRILRNREGLR